jgi:hypothetical protein
MFNANDHKAGKWLKFELGTDNPDGSTGPQLVVVAAGEVRRGTLIDEQDLQLLLDKAQRSADGRLVGVFVKGGNLHSPGSEEVIRGEDGQPAHDPTQFKTRPERFIPIPHCVAPIRAILGPDGSHNLSFAFDGQAHNVLLAIDSLKNVELVTIREDIPAFRNSTLDEDFDPAETSRPRTR